MAGVINGLVARIRTLEDTASRRVLPPGYKWAHDEAGSLVIVREEDDSVTVVVNV